VGTELELFSCATNWKRYWTAMVQPYVHGQVFDVGAGIGANASYMAKRAASWLCIEPDDRLAAKIAAQIADGTLPRTCEVFTGRLDGLPDQMQADTILYADVLEHIEDDVEEMRRAARRLRLGGHLIVLAPAHAALMSSFDIAVGHHRRYAKADIPRLTVEGLTVVNKLYLDSIGMLVSASNRAILSQSVPSRAQILFWDRVCVPLSRALDAIIRWTAGKSMLVVWKRV
jgi:SAM-dependent methyltransferase